MILRIWPHTHTHTCKTKTPIKVSSLVSGHKTPLVKILTEERGAMQRVVLKCNVQRAWLPISILRACPLINIGRRTLVGKGNGQMAHLRNGTPEHHTEYHLLLSDLIPFDQNNCHLHRYHQFCHLHWSYCHSPSHQAIYSFKGVEGGVFLDWIKCMPSRLRKKKITQGLPSYSHQHIYCFSAADIFFTYLDILTLTNLWLVQE